MIRTINYFFFILVVLLFSAGACNRGNKKTDSKLKKEVLQFESLSNKSDSAWALMMNSDDNKIQNLNRLIEELALIEGTKEDQIKPLKSEINEMVKARYDRMSMESSARIDQYDSFTNSILGKVRAEINANPNAVKYQIVHQLLAEVQAADDSILHFRKEYDRNIEAYRQYLDKNKKVLQKELPSFDSVQRYHLFRLVQ